MTPWSWFVWVERIDRPVLKGWMLRFLLMEIHFICLSSIGTHFFTPNKQWKSLIYLQSPSTWNNQSIWQTVDCRGQKRVLKMIGSCGQLCQMCTFPFPSFYYWRGFQHCKTPFWCRIGGEGAWSPIGAAWNWSHSQARGGASTWQMDWDCIYGLALWEICWYQPKYLLHGASHLERIAAQAESLHLPVEALVTLCDVTLGHLVMEKQHFGANIKNAQKFESEFLRIRAWRAWVLHGLKICWMRLDHSCGTGRSSLRTYDRSDLTGRIGQHACWCCCKLMNFYWRTG